jgi:hypothetical protein
MPRARSSIRHLADHLFEAVLTIFLLLVLFEILAHRIELIRRDDVLSA